MKKLLIPVILLVFLGCKGRKAIEWNNKGNTLADLSRYEEALEAYEKAIELKPAFAEAWYNRGVALGNLGRYEEALEAYNKALKIKPDYVYAWVKKSAALGKLGRDELQALKPFDKAIELEPDFAEYMYSKGCIYSRMGDKGNALESLSKAIELDVKYKEEAKKDEDFKNLWDDEDFKRITE